VSKVEVDLATAVAAFVFAVVVDAVVLFQQLLHWQWLRLLYQLELPRCRI